MHFKLYIYFNILVCYFHAKIIFQSLYVFEFPMIRSVLSFQWDEINTTIFLIMIFFNFYFRSWLMKICLANAFFFRKSDAWKQSFNTRFDCLLFWSYFDRCPSVLCPPPPSRLIFFFLKFLFVTVMEILLKIDLKTNLERDALNT